MYITTKHLQILDIIKKNPTFTIKDISQVLNMSTQHVKVYIEDIYIELFKISSKTLKAEDIINSIYISKNSKNTLKKVQHFNKAQNIFYMLFLLGKNNYFKLSEISKELGITTRNLNNYSANIKNILDFFNLGINISNKGVDLIGDSQNITRFKFYLYFKFLVEKNYLPKKLRDEFLSFSKIQNFKKIKKDVKKLVSLIGSKNMIYCEFVFFSLYMTYRDSQKIKKIKDISLEESLIYKPDYLKIESFNKTINFLKNSIFKDISILGLDIIFMITDNNKVSKKLISIKTPEYFENILPIFKQYLGESSNPNFSMILKSFVFYCEVKNIMFIDDSSFINLNMSHLANSNFLKLTKDTQQILPTFSFLEILTLWYAYHEKPEQKENNIFVFKYLNPSFIPMLIKEIYKKHNIEIKDFINIKNLNSYLKTNKVDNLILVENIKIYQKNIPIKNLFIPIVNYKKI
ncbi:MAG: hypothetical protein ACRDA0_03875 [Cetobacterium sp.]|uniref:hypothetical protein n=1 Tax=Cetobacterium sp. TaxID=2071632 RepID=UPI003F329929